MVEIFYLTHIYGKVRKNGAIMIDAEKLKTYAAMVETTRKWVAVMDTKAGFVSALNAGLLGFVWSGAKLIESGCWTKGLAIAATVFSLFSLLTALRVVLPRSSLQHVFGKSSTYANGFKPISFYGFVASHYPKGHDGQFIDDVLKLDEVALLREALEQHFTISHIAQDKSNLVTIAGYFLMAAIVFTSFSLLTKVIP